LWGCMSRVSSGSIVSVYGLNDRAIGVRSPAGAKDFSSNLCVQTGSGAHPASCPVGSGGPFCCEHNIEPSASIKDVGLLDVLRDYQLPM
jgi:hypothetical protein